MDNLQYNLYQTFSFPNLITNDGGHKDYSSISNKRQF